MDIQDQEQSHHYTPRDAPLEVDLSARFESADLTDSLPSSESPEPMERPVRRMPEIPEFLWYLQRKDPACVVGEQRHLPFWLNCLVRLGRNDDDRVRGLVCVAGLL